MSQRLINLLHGPSAIAPLSSWLRMGPGSRGRAASETNRVVRSLDPSLATRNYLARRICPGNCFRASRDSAFSGGRSSFAIHMTNRDVQHFVTVPMMMPLANSHAYRRTHRCRDRCEDSIIYIPPWDPRIRFPANEAENAPKSWARRSCEML